MRAATRARRTRRRARRRACVAASSNERRGSRTGWGETTLLLPPYELLLDVRLGLDYREGARVPVLARLMPDAVALAPEDVQRLDARIPDRLVLMFDAEARRIALRLRRELVARLAPALDLRPVRARVAFDRLA